MFGLISTRVPLGSIGLARPGLLHCCALILFGVDFDFSGVVRELFDFNGAAFEGWLLGNWIPGF